MSEGLLSEEFEPPSVSVEDELNLIYEIEGEPNELDVFELARTLEAIGVVLKESYQVLHPSSGELVVKVKPFEVGSFIANLPLDVKEVASAATLFAAQHHQELIKCAKETLQALGFIQKVGEKTASLLELYKRLKGDPPASVEKKENGDFDVKAGDGNIIPINSKVEKLFDNQIINKNIYNTVVVLSHDAVPNISTYLKDDPENTSVKIGKDIAKALQAYSNPPPEPEQAAKVHEDIITRVLHPKSGGYGQTKGTWQFTIAGQKGFIKAKILDQGFLDRYAKGEIRFHRDDTLTVKLHEKQTVEGEKTKMEYEILEVLDYVRSGMVAKAS